ncbi:maleylpyruvate isomerase N-terminal domain-containing protein [Actinoallomurus acanthiterrae]
MLAEQQVAFIDLLRCLDPGEWSQPTICPGWSVKDVAAHVLGDHIGRLSIHRDGFQVLHPRDGEAFPTCPAIPWSPTTTRSSWWATTTTPPISSGVPGSELSPLWPTSSRNSLPGPVSWSCTFYIPTARQRDQVGGKEGSRASPRCGKEGF